MAVQSQSTAATESTDHRQKTFTHWQFRQSEKSDWHSAKVPSTNFSDLLTNGLIADPFYRTNEDKLQWIEKEDWEYQAQIEVTNEELQHQQIELVFEGLDTYADVYLNDELVLNADNMFVEWKKEVKNFLRAGTNDLRIYFHSPLKIASEKKEDFVYPAGNDRSEDKLSVFTRKAPYHYGWDWGPRFVTSGVWRPCYLRLHDDFQVLDIRLSSQIEETQAALMVEVELEVYSYTQINLHTSCLNEDLSFESQTQELTAGKHMLEINLSVDQPKLWWPVGMGEAHLYELEFEVSSTNQTHKANKRFGFRTIEVVNEPDEMGESFYFKVNGIPVFAKGVNYIPQHSFLDQVSNQNHEQIFDDVVNANMNMVRIWGGGIYEDDHFYDLADEKGVLIWQDFMFACSMYPGDQDFLDNVRKEAEYNIKRIRNHASLAIWCGNNEIAVGWENWGWQEEFGYGEELQKRLIADYDKLFKVLLREMVDQFDPNTFYFHSSPITHYEDLSQFHIGDNHYWGVWHKEAPFEDFETHVPRFMSEYGFQSFPILDSVKKYAKEEDFDIESEVMLLHQKHGRGNQIIGEYMDREYHEPKDFESFLYLSQVQQAEGIKIAIEAHRKAMPFCMGTLYWQLNDCWPVASWSSIDHYGKWKALQYYAKRAFEDILVKMELNENQLEVHIISDRQTAEIGNLNVQLIDFDGDIKWECNKEIEVLPLVSGAYLLEDLSKELSKHNRSQVLLSATLTINDKKYSALKYPEATKNQTLPAPKLAVEKTLSNGMLEVKLTAEKFTKGVYVSTEPILDGNFSDNFFDMLPGETRSLTIPCTQTEVPEIKTLTIYHTYHS